LQEETKVSLAEDADLGIGVDTHLDTHTAAICDARGRAVSQLQPARSQSVPFGEHGDFLAIM
jgi:hypothetical protein